MPDEGRLLAALQARDEDAFVALVRRHTPAMTRVALAHVGSKAVADEVVQEAWLNVLRGIDGFEGRSTLRTWIFTILVNGARRRAQQESRSVPFAALHEWGEEGSPDVDPERFFGPDHPRWANVWRSPPIDWHRMPEERLLGAEVGAAIRGAIAGLPDLQRAVMVLRDVEGWSGPEVCAALGLAEGHQRVLLHRARTRVRRAVEAYFSESPV
jgi:RNA polymerase sigma-70 factor (ECF subfamily)